MPSIDRSRRRLLTALALAGVAGCASAPSEPTSRSTPSRTTPPQTPTLETPTSTSTRGAEPTSTTDSDGAIAIDAVTVADFVVYPLSGTHPHVHRRENTQYVVVRTDSSLSAETVRERLRLELDGDAVPLAARQPVPWRTETTDVAFAVSKREAYEDGRILVGGEVSRTLAAGVIDRLNAPPVFEVGDPTASPDQLRPGERATATVRFDLRNVGDGRGTFGASLSGNFLSGATTVTATLDPGTTKTVSGSTRVVGDGDAATVRLDWGTDEWTGEIPVVGTATPMRTPTETATPGSQ